MGPPQDEWGGLATHIATRTSGNNPGVDPASMPFCPVGVICAEASGIADCRINSGIPQTRLELLLSDEVEIVLVKICNGDAFERDGGIRVDRNHRVGAVVGHGRE